jgi:hypothetical protein
MKAILDTQSTIHCIRTHNTGEQISIGNRTHVSIIRCQSSLLLASRCMPYKTHLYCMLATSNPTPRPCNETLYSLCIQWCHPVSCIPAVSGAAPEGSPILIVLSCLPFGPDSLCVAFPRLRHVTRAVCRILYVQQTDRTRHIL